MLYQIAKPIAHVAFSIYFRKIFFSNVQNIPAGKPVILALNHPTAFVEPCIVASFQDRPLNFLARGDFFANSLSARILADFNIIPIFRIQDGGYGKLKANFESFKECYRAFEENKVVLIMAEGGAEHEKQLRPLKKGTARLAFGALEHAPDLDLYIVPVGVNYTKSEEMRHIAMFNFAEPIRIQDYQQMHAKAPAKAIREVTAELKEKLSKNVIQVEKGEEEWVNFLLDIQRNSWEIKNFNIKSNSKKLLEEEKYISDKILKIDANEKQLLKEKTQLYQQVLDKNKVIDEGLAFQKMYTFENHLKLGIGLLPSLIGRIINWSPMWLAGKLGKRVIPNDMTFEIPIKITLGIIFYAIYWMIFFVIGLVTGNYWWWSLLILLPILGIFHLQFNDFAKRLWQVRKVKNLQPDILENLEKKRQNLINILKR